MGLFGMKKGTSVMVGPPLYGLYEVTDAGNRPAFVKYLAGAPSGGELVATFKGAPLDRAEAILRTFQQFGLPGGAVEGAQVYGDGFAIYIKGDLPSDAIGELEQLLLKMGESIDSEVYVTGGRFDGDQLRELMA